MPASPRSRPIRRLVLAAALVAGCDNGTTSPPPPPPPPPGIGASGGTVAGPGGAQVVIPAGALATNTTIEVAQSSAGAPAVPTGFTAFGPMYAFTPHGTAFATPATVTVPFDPASVPAGRPILLYKTTAGQAGWERVPTLAVGNGVVTAQVSSFSHFQIGGAPPSLSQQPQDAEVTEPATATFTVAALALPPVTYQWERSTDGGTVWNPAPGATATTAAYTTPPTVAATDHGARYRVTIENPDGPTTSAAAVLTVHAAVAPPTITGQPQDVTAAAGGPAAFTVVAAGSGLGYQWQRSDAGSAFVDIPGATAATYTVTAVAAGDDGARFRAVVSNGGGSVTSGAALLTVTTIPPGPTIAAGQNFSLFRYPNGAVSSWGDDLIAQLGAGPGNQSRSLPGSTIVGPDVVAVAAGALHALAVRADGSVRGWGYDTFGQLGTGGGLSKEIPVIARMAGGATIDHAVNVCAGVLHSLVLRSTAPGVVAMGYNGNGQIGDGTPTDRPEAVPVIGTAAQAIACGSNFSMAIVNGQVKTWGMNLSGQLGDGTRVSRHAPVTVSLPGAAVAIAAGNEHALAIMLNGDVWAWGSNLNGKLGPNGPTGGDPVTATPVRVTGLPSGATPLAVAAGDENSAVIVDHKVYVWGINEVGQLGRGSLSPGFDGVPRAALLPAGCDPVEVVISKGSPNHLLVRCASNVNPVYAWGWNDAGQLGLGPAAPALVSTPTALPLFIP
ncbi:MAG: hypothetical protein AB7S39_04110 [Gemmatimonadales bacterium]